MRSKTRSTPVDSSAPEGAIAGPVSNGSPIAGGADPTTARATATTDVETPARATATTDVETRRERSRRKAHRSRLHGYAILAVVLVAFLIALAASNTAHVKVSWVFGSSHVSLVWLVLFAGILGWVLGLLATAAFHWRTRAPSPGGEAS